MDLPTLRLERSSPTSPIDTSNGDLEFISEKQAAQISLPNSALWPLIITEVVADGNCGFRAVAHITHGRESRWPEVRQRPLDHLNSNPAGYLQDVTITSRVEISLQSLQASLTRFVGPILEHSKRLDSDKHA